MTQVTVRCEIGASAADVWARVGDFGSPDSNLAVERCEVDGQGVGCVRTLHLIGGDVVRDRLEQCDDASRCLGWCVLELSGVPVCDCHSTMRVNEAGADRCEVEMVAMFEPAGVPESDAMRTMEAIYMGAIHSIKEQAERAKER